MRVEALPTPSEHIPALMEQLKSLYLSQACGELLFTVRPREIDPSRGWGAEDFLNAPTRMKGRLLKRGESGVDSVAKIFLSGWVKKRVPFFVLLPERPEELNKAEAKEKVGQETPTVKQNLKSIVQKNPFRPEDVRPLESEGETVGGVEEDSEGGSGEESSRGRRKNPPTRSSCHRMACSKKTTRQRGQRRVYLRLEMVPCACHRWI